MNRDDALRLARVAYKSLKCQIYEWSMDYSNIGHCFVSLNWKGSITVDHYTFTEKELMEDSPEKKRCTTCDRDLDKIEPTIGLIQGAKSKAPGEGQAVMADWIRLYSKKES